MPISTDDWQANVKRALMQDPKKTGVMAALLIVLAIVSIRTFGGGSSIGPAAASASIAAHPTLTVLTTPVVTPVSRIDPTLRQWLIAPVPSTVRNEFLVRSEFFPIDNSKPPPELSDGVFWVQLEKSLSIQADQTTRRQNTIDSIRHDAESIRPQSTMLGANPRVIVNNRLLAEGETISGFKVLKIRTRGIIVQRDGVVLDVPMR